MWGLSRLRRSQRVRRLLASPVHEIRSLANIASRRIAALRRLPGRTLDRVWIGADNGLRRLKGPGELNPEELCATSSVTI